MGFKNTLHISGFPRGIRARELAPDFEKIGKIVRIDIPPGRSPYSRPYAFVEYEDVHDAEQAIEELHGQPFSLDPQFTLIVEWARSEPHPSRRPGAPVPLHGPSGGYESGNRRDYGYPRYPSRYDYSYPPPPGPRGTSRDFDSYNDYPPPPTHPRRRPFREDYPRARGPPGGYDRSGSYSRGYDRQSYERPNRFEEGRSRELSPQRARDRDDREPYRNTPPEAYETAPPESYETAPPEPYESAPPEPYESAPPEPYESAPPKPYESAPPKPYESASPSTRDNTSKQGIHNSEVKHDTPAEKPLQNSQPVSEQQEEDKKSIDPQSPTGPQKTEQQPLDG